MLLQEIKIFFLNTDIVKNSREGGVFKTIVPARFYRLSKVTGAQYVSRSPLSMSLVAEEGNSILKGGSESHVRQYLRNFHCF